METSRNQIEDVDSHVLCQVGDEIDSTKSRQGVSLGQNWIGS